MVALPREGQREEAALLGHDDRVELLFDKGQGIWDLCVEGFIGRQGKG